MILELTKENLQKCGFDDEQIIKLLEWDNHIHILINDTCYYATNIDNKIYTEIDGYRKNYFENGNIAFPLSCPELINEYFNLSLNKYFKQQKILLKTMFVEADQRKNFITIEIQKTENSIENKKAMLNKLPHFLPQIKLDAISIYEAYIHFLNNKLNEPNYQSEADIIFEYKKAILGYFKHIINPKDNNGNVNPLYYYDRIVGFKNTFSDQLEKNNNLKERKELLTSYNARLSNLLMDVVQLFIACDKYNGSDETVINDVHHSKINVDYGFKAIKEFKQNIQYNISDGNTDFAIKIKNYCIPLFNEIKIILNDNFCIDIENSPLKNDFDEVLNVLENSIDLNELNLLNELNKSKNEQPHQAKTSKPKRLKKTLIEFIHNVENKEAFLQDLKITFPTEIGKSIKAIIDFLNKERILIYGTKEFKQLFEELENYFSRNIGSYNSVQNVKEIDKETNETISKKLNPLIIKYKSK